RGANQRRGAVASLTNTRQQFGPGQQRPRALDLEHQRADMGCLTEHLKIPFAERAAGIERCLEQALRRGIRSGYFERDGFELRRLAAWRPSAAGIRSVPGPPWRHAA